MQRRRALAEITQVLGSKDTITGIHRDSRFNRYLYEVFSSSTQCSSPCGCNDELLGCSDERQAMAPCRPPAVIISGHPDTLAALAELGNSPRQVFQLRLPKQVARLSGTASQ